ncbi:hypothetical protein T484DRAFT_1791624, partial [Baffinella frigidus]
VDGTAPVIFTVSHPLPKGLVIDRATGAITGVPEQATESALYTIKARPSPF